MGDEVKLSDRDVMDRMHEFHSGSADTSQPSDCGVTMIHLNDFRFQITQKNYDFIVGAAIASYQTDTRYTSRDIINCAVTFLRAHIAQSQLPEHKTHAPTRGEVELMEACLQQFAANHHTEDSSRVVTARTEHGFADTNALRKES